MWRWLATGLLLAGAAATGDDPDVAARFAPTLPAAVGDVSTWEIITGRFETGNERGSYLFYVNPARAGMYQLMRYRVELRAAASQEERQRGGAERVAFIARPGVREPMLCWERLAGAEPAWREVTAGTGEYLLEMQVLMHVLAAQRAAPTPTPPP
jgi:hypothetical protein